MKRLALLLTLLIPVLTSNAYANNDWQKSEHNYTFKYNNFSTNIRTYFNDDYDHVEFGYKIGWGMSAALRLAESGSQRENRYKLSQKMYKNKYLSLGHQIEYRAYEGATDDYFRYRLIGKLKVGNAWLKVQPRWTLGQGQENATRVKDIKTNVGYDLKFGKQVTFSPYVMYIANGETLEKNDLMAGTALTFRF